MACLGVTGELNESKQFERKIAKFLCLGVTGELNESKQFEWKIAKFLSLPAKEGRYYSSPSFVFANTSFHLNFYPSDEMLGRRTFTKSEPIFTSLFLKNESRSSISVFVTLHIKKADGALIGGGSQYVCMKPESLFGYGLFYNRHALEQNESEILPDGNLTVICILKTGEDEKQAITEVEKVENLQEKQAQETENYKKLTDLEELSNNLSDLFIDKETCDTVLHVEDKDFKAHKTILMARSSVFAAMFKHDTLEKRTGFVNISDCDAESFQEFLDFIYSGKLEDISFRSAFHLYSTSNKYNVKNLKEFCTEYLTKSLTSDNVCEVVVLADKYDEMKLLSAAQDFFTENFSEVFATCAWENLLKNDYRLANKLLLEMGKVKGSR